MVTCVMAFAVDVSLERLRQRTMVCGPVPTAEVAGDQTTIDARRTSAREQSDQATSDYDREKLQERVTKVAGGVALVWRA
ncbi:hypothetical protein D7S74_02605 [Ralstonia pickettii]|nr:hypothetical protein [Ralstonia pickettii]MBA9849884.1 hypothetical protein [Ralstonia pickettii]MBA9876705.1 hypothetical protein [Ralstonia pickettii]MBA9880549.1 hypothetical protein [Ralstonia pickettii]MBA9886513.1 hypothetical protein [Ralstonia pickettii]